MSEQIIFSVTGNANEWQVLINLLDVATKASGLQGAKAAVVWSERIQKAADDSKPAVVAMV